jgi:hypothetical protein
MRNLKDLERLGYPAPDLGAADADIVEVSFLLPGWQVAALEATAHAQGLTTGQMTRRLIQDFFSKFVQHPPISGAAALPPQAKAW